MADRVNTKGRRTISRRMGMTLGIASYDVATHLDAIHRTVDPIVRGQRATIVGHSMGAILAAEYARRYRNEVSGLIVLDAPMFRSEEDGRSSSLATMAWRRLHGATLCW